MVRLTVSDEDARLIAEATTPIILVDRAGRHLGQVTPVDGSPAISSEKLAELQRRLREPDECTTWPEIKERLDPGKRNDSMRRGSVE